MKALFPMRLQRGREFSAEGMRAYRHEFLWMESNKFRSHRIPSRKRCSWTRVLCSGDAVSYEMHVTMVWKKCPLSAGKVLSLSLYVHAPVVINFANSLTGFLNLRKDSGCACPSAFTAPILNCRANGRHCILSLLQRFSRLGAGSALLVR
ncbi:hypothetical protein Y032_0600g484 [Ancylostoma ceylanicum]|uniref:Uncharacterized protein n=1 Tax=Ancylostoma ceylanicum TaxID=53326 RepID=A0A016WNV9_9BILA|nr:hypothetical protein Y032_0600g484 [Ancylostoma ceylanicum]